MLRMLKISNLLKKAEFNKSIIFIIGSGRSGTHLIGRTFASAKNVQAYIEDDKFFKPITEIAVGINKNELDYEIILKQYKKEFQKSKYPYILEKTHPNIWFVERIIDYFPNAKFVGIKRDVFATVNSMLNHKGVLSWYDKLPLNQLNPFLGIDKENIGIFKSLPIESKCALRWKSHIERLDYLKQRFPDHIHIIDYEDFYYNSDNLIKGLNDFLGADLGLTIEPLNKTSNDKWKSNLSNMQKTNIEEVLKKI